MCDFLVDYVPGDGTTLRTILIIQISISVLLHTFLRGHDMGKAYYEVDIDQGGQEKNWV